MPQLLKDGLPDPARRKKFDFAEWADGQAWRFVKGEDYDSSTETFREHVRRWAKANGYNGDRRCSGRSTGDPSAISASSAGAAS